MAQKILVVDDDNDMCLLLNRFLTRNGFEVSIAHTGSAALDWLKKHTPDLVLSDFRLDDMTGAELLVKIKEVHAAAPVIIITGYSDVKDAVEVMKMGAYDYVTKPLLPDEILITIKRALSNTPKSNGSAVTASPAKDAAPAVKGKPGAAVVEKGWNNNEYILGDSPAFATIVKQINLVAPTNFSVIIYGESGSGKEVIAQQIHKKSKRAGKPFVAIDCGALS